MIDLTLAKRTQTAIWPLLLGQSVAGPNAILDGQTSKRIHFGAQAFHTAALMTGLMAPRNCTLYAEAAE